MIKPPRELGRKALPTRVLVVEEDVTITLLPVEAEGVVQILILGEAEAILEPVSVDLVLGDDIEVRHVMTGQYIHKLVAYKGRWIVCDDTL